MNFTLILSVLMVVLGGYLIIRVFVGKPQKVSQTTLFGKELQWRIDGRDMPSFTAVFSSICVKNTSRNLLSATCSAVFGRLRVDLSETVITHDVTIFCNAVLGQVTVFAPRNVRIVCRNVPLLGGVQLRAESLPPDAAAPIVTLDCTTVLGGVDIR